MQPFDATLDIKLDNQAFNKGIAESENAVEGFGKSATDVATSIAAAFASSKIIGALNSTVNAFEKQRKSFMQIDAVFGSSAASARKAAEQLDRAYGISVGNANELMITTGKAAAGLGLYGERAVTVSKQVQDLAINLGTLHNAEASNVSAALTMAMQGSSRALRQYGVTLDDAAVKQDALNIEQNSGYSISSRAATAMATLAAVTKQSGAATGAYAAESQSLTSILGRVRANIGDIAENIGEYFYPAFVKAAKVAESFTKFIKELPVPLVGTAAAVAGVTTAVTLLVPAIKLLDTAFKSLGLTGIVTQLQQVTKGLTAVGGATAGIGAAQGAGAAAGASMSAGGVFAGQAAATALGVGGARAAEKGIAATSLATRSSAMRNAAAALTTAPLPFLDSTSSAAKIVAEMQRDNALIARQSEYIKAGRAAANARSPVARGDTMGLLQQGDRWMDYGRRIVPESTPTRRTVSPYKAEAILRTPVAPTYASRLAGAGSAAVAGTTAAAMNPLQTVTRALTGIGTAFSQLGGILATVTRTVAPLIVRFVAWPAAIVGIGVAAATLLRNLPNLMHTSFDFIFKTLPKLAEKAWEGISYAFAEGTKLAITAVQQLWQGAVGLLGGALSGAAETAGMALENIAYAIPNLFGADFKSSSYAAYEATNKLNEAQAKLAAKLKETAAATAAATAAQTLQLNIKTEAQLNTAAAKLVHETTPEGTLEKLIAEEKKLSDARTTMVATLRNTAQAAQPEELITAIETLKQMDEEVIKARKEVLAQEQTMAEKAKTTMEEINKTQYRTATDLALATATTATARMKIMTESINHDAAELKAKNAEIQQLKTRQSVAKLTEKELDRLNTLTQETSTLTSGLTSQTSSLFDLIASKAAFRNDTIRSTAVSGVDFSSLQHRQNQAMMYTLRQSAIDYPKQQTEYLKQLVDGTKDTNTLIREGNQARAQTPGHVVVTP